MRSLHFVCLTLVGAALATQAFAQATSPGRPPSQQQTPPVQIQPQATVPAITTRAPLAGQVPVLIMKPGGQGYLQFFDVDWSGTMRATRATRERPDGDGDGYDARQWGGADCDDDDPRRNPGEAEAFDVEGLDEDCNHETLPNRDQDRDGYISWQAMNVLRTPGGIPRAVVRGPDCDDERADVHPGLVEVRGDLRDNDCDGLIDVIDAPGHRDYCPPTEYVSAQTLTRPCGSAGGDTSQFQRR